jgi:hypothetical protein
MEALPSPFGYRGRSRNSVVGVELGDEIPECVTENPVNDHQITLVLVLGIPVSVMNG